MEALGFHKACGGRVRRTTITTRHTRQDGSVRVTTKAYVCCSSCVTSVPEADIVPDPIPRVHQRVCGKRVKVPRYDYRSWRDV